MLIIVDICPSKLLSMAEGPCKSVDEVVALQKDNLIAAINESYVAESKRIERLSIAKTASDRKFLTRRFEVERQADMQRIERLKTDYDALNKKVADGEFIVRDESMVSSAAKSGQSLQTFQSRFHGLDTAEEIVSNLNVIYIKSESNQHSSFLLKRFFRGMWSAIDKRDSMVQARYAKQAAVRDKQMHVQMRSEQDKVSSLSGYSTRL